ncbi:villin-1 [Gossypium australe]|uniref:Villin-1 n=1 Tax=Gossypium australe TaxID=47621 RepID=A0A5B6X7J8_9ROSI|nr:villin-1 [Gossypium australe]
MNTLHSSSLLDRHLDYVMSKRKPKKNTQHESKGHQQEKEKRKTNLRGSDRSSRAASAVSSVPVPAIRCLLSSAIVFARSGVVHLVGA